MNEIGLQSVVGEDFLERCLLVGQAKFLCDVRVEASGRGEQAGLRDPDQHDLGAPALREAHHGADVVRRLRFVELSQEIVAAVTEDDELWLGFVERCGLIDRREVVLSRARTIPVAYVLFDHHHAQARATVQRHFEAHGVQLAGRYGKWEYSSMEDALLSGREAAHKLA